MSALLTFGPFRIDLANEILWRGEERLALKPKTFAVLRSLTERPQQLVTKEELLDALWGDVAVGDAVLKTCIGEIRQVLGEQASTPTFIETVHRRGYRFLVIPTPMTSSSVTSSPRLLVGRECELDTLVEWWEQAKEGNRQIVFVTGEPGIGKTSLVDTFLDHVQGNGGTWIGRGQCIEQYGAGEAYLPILEGLGRLCRQAGGEELVACLRQYAPTWLMQLPGLVDPAEMPQLLPTVMGATPVRMMREFGDAVEEFTREHPIVLCLEDLHWLDASSLELLTYVARRSNPARLLVLGTYRPADLILLEHPLKQTKQELLVHGQCQELRLECLTEEAVEEFLRQRLAGGEDAAASVHALAHVIHQRTEGNPLFMVNIVDYLTNHDLLILENQEWHLREDAATTAIPTGLRQFIDLRIEQLDPEDRQILAVASVAGMAFTTATLAAGVETSMADIEARLHALVHREQFIRDRGISEWPDGTRATTYELQHALYQEALYEQLPEAQREKLHRKIGERLERGYGERTRDIAVGLALHFARGHDLDRASTYHQQVGEDAFKRHAFPEAIFHLTKGLEFLQSLPPGPNRDHRELILQSTLGVPLLFTKGYSSPEAGAAFGRARELYPLFPESPATFPILHGLMRYFGAIGQGCTALEISDQILDLAQQSGDSTLLASAHESKGGAALIVGDIYTARKHLEESLSLTLPESADTFFLQCGEDPRIVGRLFLGWVLCVGGFLDRGIQVMKEGEALARTLAHPHILCGTLMSLGHGHLIRQEISLALKKSMEALALAEQEGLVQWVGESLTILGWAKIHEGKDEEGWADSNRGLGILRQIEYKVFMTFHLASFAESALCLRSHEKGLAATSEALDLVSNYDIGLYRAELIRLKGELTLGLGLPDKEQAAQEAEDCFQKAIKIAGKQKAKLFELRAVMSLSRLWQQQGKGKEARPKLKKIYDWFTEGFDTKDLKDAKALLADLK